MAREKSDCALRSKRREAGGRERTGERPAAKPPWQHRTHFVANTRWWPPFCLVVDFVVAAVIAFEIVAGLDFH
jgi:hypothetical protein